MTDTAFLFKKPRVDFSVMTSGNQKNEFYQRYWANLAPFFSYSGLFKARSHLNLPLQRSWIINDVHAFFPIFFGARAIFRLLQISFFRKPEGEFYD